jgi:hypothetical protein
VKAAAGAFVFFAALGFAVAGHTLRWPMVFDDLHLVKTYTPAERAGAWTGHWDPDRVETAGYRPLSTTFNHVRAWLFGERVGLHRAALVVLFALDLALLVPLAARLGLPSWTAVVAGALMLTTRYSAYHYAWITDGNHLAQGLAVLGGALLAVDGVRHGSAWRVASSVIAVGAGLLVREDTFAAVPGVALLVWWTAPRERRRWVVGWLLGALFAALLLVAARRAFVPEAQGLRLDLGGFLRAVARVLNPVGWEAFDVPSRVSSWGAAVLLLATAGGLVAARAQRESRLALLWLAGAGAACAPALVLQRDDLFFFPSLFVALFLATAWTAVTAARPSARPLVAVAAAWLVAGGAWTSAAQAENFHPMSARAIDWDTEMLYGDYAAARIPAGRRAVVAARLDALGIREGQQPRQRVRALVAEAKESGRRRPGPEGTVFFPRLPERYF